MGLSTGTYCVPLSGSSKNGDPSRRSAVVIFGKRMRKPADQLVATAAFALLIFVSRICRSLGGYFSIAAGQARTAPIRSDTCRDSRGSKSDAIRQLHTSPSKDGT